ncbi:homeobox protein knotted-1-like 1 [Malus domestica]|uniref:homeobox protein knotted-1-like 1 n=1 Tax=Malus domestica TaxID=3750 RepID=UPI0039765E9D
MEGIYSGEHEENNGVVKVCSTREKGEGDIVEEEEEVLKRRIAGHPLYGLLLENHTDCLKLAYWSQRDASALKLILRWELAGLMVGLGEIGDQIGDKSTTTTDNNIVNAKQFIKDATSSDRDSSNLDQFMEAYCNGLNKLKEAMADPMKEMTSFITAMYAQLEDLSGSKKKTITHPACWRRSGYVVCVSAEE